MSILQVIDEKIKDLKKRIARRNDKIFAQRISVIDYEFEDDVDFYEDDVAEDKLSSDLMLEVKITEFFTLIMEEKAKIARHDAANVEPLRFKHRTELSSKTSPFYDTDYTAMLNAKRAEVEALINAEDDQTQRDIWLDRWRERYFLHRMKNNNEMFPQFHIR
jgi:hypothetical protein